MNRSFTHLLATTIAAFTFGSAAVLFIDTPPYNVWLTMLSGLGIEAERHGDSTGVVKELMA